MDLSHLTALEYTEGRNRMLIIFIKKETDRKGILITYENGVIVDLQSLYPSAASRLFFEHEARCKNRRSWKYADAGRLKTLVAVNPKFDRFGVFQQDTFLNRIRQII